MPIIEDEAFRDWPVDENGDDKELKSLEDIPVDEFDLKTKQPKISKNVSTARYGLQIWMIPAIDPPILGG